MQPSPLSSSSLKESLTEILYDGLVQLCGGGIWIESSKKTGSIPSSDDIRRRGGLVLLCETAWLETLRNMIRSTISVRIDPKKAAAADSSTGKYNNNVEIRTMTALFKRYGRNQNKKATTAIRILEMVSDLGVTRTFHSAYELAMAIVPILEELCRRRCSISNHGIRVCHKSGFLLLLYSVFEEKDGFHTLPNTTTAIFVCPECPSTECRRNAKSLWWHLQSRHGFSHEMAMEITHHIQTRDATAIVPYHPTTLTMQPQPPQPSTSKKTITESKNSMLTNEEQDEHNEKNLVNNTTSSSSIICHNNNNTIMNHTTIDSSDPFTYCRKSDWSGLLHYLQRLDRSQIHDVPTRSIDRHGATILHWAAGSSGSLELVRYLIEQMGFDPDQPQQPPKRHNNNNKRRRSDGFAGRTPLHWAARNGHVSIVRYLLKETATFSSSSVSTRRMEAATDDGTTAFAWAAWQHHLPVLQILVQHGCRVDTMNRFGCNAALWAAQGNTQDTKKRDDPNTTTTTTTTATGVSVMEFLDRVGCPLDVRNHSGHGILHKAAQRGNALLCQWWIQEKLWIWVQNENSTEDIDHSQQQGKKTRNQSRVWLRVLDLLGPDHDGCVASDLAGMEHFEDLARYLARQEVELVHSILEKMFFFERDEPHRDNSQPSSHTQLQLLPDWLMEGVRYPMIMSKNTIDRYHHKMHWGSWEGVYRMRSVLTQEKFRTTKFLKELI